MSRKNAGTGKLTLEVTDPRGKALKVDQLMTSGGEENFTFLPVELGPHEIGIKLAGFPVPGIPSLIHISIKFPSKNQFQVHHLRS